MRGRSNVRMLLAAGAAIALAGCGDVGEKAAELHGKADAAVEESAVAGAIVSAIDEEAVQTLVDGAVKDAVREAIPPEAAAVAAVVDEEALVTGLDEAIDGKAFGGAVRDVIAGTAETPEAKGAE